jgi:hypothetical protein
MLNIKYNNISCCLYNTDNVETNNVDFEHRSDNIIKLIKSFNTDIMGIINLKNLKNSSIEIFLDKICDEQYDYVLSSIDNNDTFKIACIYNKNKLFVRNVKYIDINTNTNNNRKILCVLMSQIINGKITEPSFWVLLTQLNIQKEQNYNQSLWINDNIQNYMDDKPYLLMIDTKWLRPIYSYEHSKFFENKHIIHSTNNIYDYSNNKEIKTTYIGFLNEQYKKNNIYTINEKYINNNLIEYPSDLLHIFTNKSHDWIIKHKYICTNTFVDNHIVNNSNGNFASDYLPFLFEIHSETFYNF